jgi:RND family efflux transporter MFP subunit
VPYIKLGGQVQIKVSSTGHTFTGSIVRFTRALDPSTRTMLVEVDVPNSDLKLSPGMYAEDTFQLQHKDDSLTLPIQAVVQSGTQPYVLIVDATHHVERRNVTLGIQTANRVEVVSGVRAGEQVIASGQTEYQSGEVVTPRPAFIPTEAQELGN